MLKGRLGLEGAGIPHADRHGLLWVGRGELYVEDGTARFRTAGGGPLPAGDYAIPYQMVSTLVCGPGTSLTHDALRIMARHGTGVVIAGEDGVRFYASLPAGVRTSRLARRHATLWADPGKRVWIARRMYAMRFGEMLPSTDIHALRGLEGVRVKAMYEHEAHKAGIAWRGRRYDRQNPGAGDAPNQCLNHVATAAEACALVACAAVGALPELGFVHEDADSAFALDIADLYRQTFTVAVAFRAAAEATRSPEDLERIARRHAGEAVRRGKLVSSMIDRIKELLDADDGGGDP